MAIARYAGMMTWTQIQRIQEYKALKSMYFWLLAVPFLAKLLNQVNDTLDVTLFGASVTLTMDLPFSWQIFYFSAVFIVLGDIIFHNKCPDILKDHPSYSHFKNDGKSAMQIMQYAEQLDVRESISEIFARNQSSGFVTHGGIANEESIQEAFWVVFNKARNINALYRITCSGLYYVGLGLIGIVLLENLYEVIKLTVHSAYKANSLGRQKSPLRVAFCLR